MNQFPPSIWENFYGHFEFFRKFAEIFTAQGAPPVSTTPVANESLSRKILIILFGHLWVVELTYIYIFAFKFTLRCLQPDIVLIICHRCQRHRRQICRRCRWYRWQFATSVVDTGGKFAAGIVDIGGKFATGVNSTRETGGKICRRCRWYRWPPVLLTPVVHLDLRISPQIFEKIWNGPNGTLWGWGETDS
jgi:hypothetical protein